MFDDFDSSLMDNPEFKEDSVREEIVVPILKRLGYSASGANRIIRSKPLLHPFVMIGSKKHAVNIVPDYLLYSEDRPTWVLDAKRPDAELIKSKGCNSHSSRGSTLWFKSLRVVLASNAEICHS